MTELIHRLDQIDGVQWIRIMYLYPDEITESLIETIKNCSKVVPYVDLPIQHISTELLKRMNRRGSGEDIRHIFRPFGITYPAWSSELPSLWDIRERPRRILMSLRSS